MAVHPARKPTQPYRPSDPQPWASDLLETQHEEALYLYGEMCVYTMMWRAVDFREGRVEHCTTCFGGEKNRQAAAFGQPTQSECPDCYGTTFEGGYRAQIIRPTLFSDRNSEMRDDSRGTVVSDTLQVETTAEFTLHKGDYVFRFDNARYQVEEKREAVSRTGFGPPLSINSHGGSTTARLESETAVAHLIPPTDSEILRDVLGTYGGVILPNLDDFTFIRPGGYLIDGVQMIPTGAGLHNVVLGDAPPPPDLAAGVIYLDRTTGLLYKGV